MSTNCKGANIPSEAVMLVALTSPLKIASLPVIPALVLIIQLEDKVLLRVKWFEQSVPNTTLPDAVISLLIKSALVLISQLEVIVLLKVALSRQFLPKRTLPLAVNSVFGIICTLQLAVTVPWRIISSLQLDPNTIQTLQNRAGIKNPKSWRKNYYLL